MVAASTSVNLGFSAKDLTVFPPLAQKVAGQLSRGEGSPDCILELIALDPALTASILGLAARTRPIVPPVTLTDAVEILGTPRVLGLAGRISTETVLLEKDDMVWRDFWQHAVTVACISRILAGRMSDVRASWAYTAGLLHDIGRLPLYRMLRTDYLNLYEQALAEREPVLAQERKVLGTDHAVVGEQLLTELHLPMSLVQPIAAHHRPLSMELQDPQAALVTRIVALADAVAHRIGGDLDFRDPDLEIEADLARNLHLNGDELDKLVEEAERETFEATSGVTTNARIYIPRL